MKISQHRLTIRLERNNQLLPTNYRHIYQNAQGNLVHHKNSNTAADPHCYYHGLENNDPHNYAILSSCHGLQGIFSFQGEIFRIQPSNPQSTSLNSLHVVSKLNHLNHYHRITRSICNIEEADTSSLVGKEINWKPDLWRQRRILNVNTMYIELVIVNDYQQVQKFKGNLTALEENIFQIVNHLDSIYKSVNIRIGLTGIVSWNIKNPITVTNEARRTLDNFATYKINTLSKLFNLDNAQLLTGLSLNQHSGLAYISTICSPQSVGVVQSYDDNFDATVTVIAHELGHNLGMRHDNNDVCHCQFKPDHAYRCIMSSALTEPPPQTFSSCSLDQLNITIQQGKVDCLFNKPIQVITPPRCGNGLQENGEECDCGSLQECANSCCNATTCKLYDGVQCQSGPCCNQCHFKAFGELCRQSINQCDLPEYCNGQSAACPADVVKQSTTPCDNSSGYCYRGSCLTINRQCKTLWGSTSYPALPICWNTLNIRGDNYGFCKQNGNDYKPCNPIDVYCGALQCNSSADNPNGQNIECKSVTINDANSINMLNHVANGTKCGHDKICINHQCLDINKLTDIIQCLPSNCSGHGVSLTSNLSCVDIIINEMLRS
ncbi:uncharacterized protein TRIADDRAFT_32386 [Trichoplax adhaerens]|uniref:Peptidase M12B domain-containing protein n=1 Tax=Trichoplax adhaerens TaxID=10228 RepID=B3SAW2_TRIAD|nr:hypothetical protein TRIADDRAFT_32386 [Trichoplax adhaerens]EDV20172.1 hypothetical protein TRIADDRAFT_32386 [Trichoplax adhaerens]|eukprot:XP_002117333.1 hypothetical protein TRIADDRAFT_32386 [Trichoplax adhaerens]